MSKDREKFLAACQSGNAIDAKESWAKMDEKQQEHVLTQDGALDIATLNQSKVAMSIMLNAVSRNLDSVNILLKQAINAVTESLVTNKNEIFLHLRKTVSELKSIKITNTLYSLLPKAANASEAATLTIHITSPDNKSLAPAASTALCSTTSPGKSAAVTHVTYRVVHSKADCKQIA